MFCWRKGEGGASLKTCHQWCMADSHGACVAVLGALRLVQPLAGDVLFAPPAPQRRAHHRTPASARSAVSAAKYPVRPTTLSHMHAHARTHARLPLQAHTRHCTIQHVRARTAPHRTAPHRTAPHRTLAGLCTPYHVALLYGRVLLRVQAVRFLVLALQRCQGDTQLTHPILAQ
jgi:hypothetical protein